MSPPTSPPPTSHPILHPRTPSFDSTSHPTPAFSSPITPSGPHSTFVPRMMTHDGNEDNEALETEGLGFGDVSMPLKRGGEGETSGNVVIAGQESVDVTPVAPGRRVAEAEKEVEEGEEDDLSREDEDDLPSASEIQRIRQRLEEMGTEGGSGEDKSRREELVPMIHTLLKPAARSYLLQEQIDAQRETIKTMQQQANVSQSLMKIERDRHRVERDGWHAELAALDRVREKEIEAGARPKKVLDLDVGYHQELEAMNKRLEMDNRLMAPRLADTQRQIDKLVAELRYLRSQVVVSHAPIAEASTSYRSTEARPRSPSPGRPQTAMGDARTEHLLLAARKVRTMRQHDDRVGRLTLKELQRGGVVGPEGGVGYSEGYVEGVEGEDELDDSDEDEKPSANRSAKSRIHGIPLLPKTKKAGKRAGAPPTTPRSKMSSQHPQTTPGGSNFNDLLRAAELATRPTSPTPHSASVHLPLSMSAARTTSEAREESNSERGSPVKKVRREPPTSSWTSTSGGAEDDSSALDLLVQASQLEVPLPSEGEQPPSSVPRPSAAGDVFNSPREDSGLAPAIALRASGETGDVFAHPSSTPKARPRAVSNVSEVKTPARPYSQMYEDSPYRQRSPPSGGSRDIQEVPPGAYTSPTGAAVPGLGKYTHLTSSMPAKRVRSPYLKWTVEEDELLARAVAIHGEKWDLVSKGVPTRSYHQVRQRWLRKTGAFDKKPKVQPDQSALQHMQDDGEDDGEGGSPTPGGGRSGKKRKADQLVFHEYEVGAQS